MKNKELAEPIGPETVEASPTTRKPRKPRTKLTENQPSISRPFVKSLSEICKRLKVAEETLYSQYVASNYDPVIAGHWLTAVTQLRVAKNQLERATHGVTDKEDSSQ
jgi:hypothetical protein